MPVAHADLIALLKHELLFLERGGYRCTRFPWRPAFLLQDTLTCPRGTFGGGCSRQSCPWLAFTLSKHHAEETPCRHIMIGRHGETIDVLYRTATREEYEENFRQWLIGTIARLEGLAA